MIDFSLNIIGSEWIIIIFVAIVLILGTNKLPEAAQKLGKAMNEYKKAKNGIETQMKDYSKQNLEVSGPAALEGYVTFGAFKDNAKLSEQTLGLWA